MCNVGVPVRGVKALKPVRVCVQSLDELCSDRSAVPRLGDDA